MSNDSHINKLKWRCRRGMLELDVILQDFIENTYQSISPELQVEFERLIEVEDTELYAWLMGIEKPANNEFSEILSCFSKTLKNQ